MQCAVSLNQPILFTSLSAVSFTCFNKTDELLTSETPEFILTPLWPPSNPPFRNSDTYCALLTRLCNPRNNSVDYKVWSVVHNMWTINETLCCILAGSVHLRLRQSARSVVRFHHHDFHRVPWVPCRSLVSSAAEGLQRTSTKCVGVGLFWQLGTNWMNELLIRQSGSSTWRLRA